jgi:mRNA interferase RelE/StbE
VSSAPTPRYTVEFARPALREFQNLPRPAQERVAPRIDALAGDPRPRGAKMLKGQPDLYRIRVGDYRVVYAIRDDRLVVLVVRVAHRRDVYRKGG